MRTGAVEPCAITELPEAKEEPSPAIQKQNNAIDISTVNFWKTPSTDLASRLRRQTVKARFPSLEDHIIEHIFEENDGQLEATLFELRALYPDDEATAPSEKLQPSQKVEADIESSTQDNPEETAQESPSLLHDGNVSPRYQDVDFRKEATRQAKLRSMYFRQAAQAYADGNGAAAAMMSRKGREHTELMKKYQRQAFRQNFYKRNHGRMENLAKVDLHGLHVQEAIEVVEELLEWHRQSLRENSPAKKKYLYLITGTGKHSHRGKPRLKPAILKLLREKKYVVNEQNGVLVVKLPTAV